MSQKKSKIWSIALPLSVLFLGAAYYIKMPNVRQAVDARTPVVRNLLGRFVQEPVKVVVLQGEQDPLFAKSKPAHPAVPEKAAPAPARQAPAQAPEPMPVPEPPAVAPPAPLVPSAPDWPAIARDRSLWPKKVTLTQPATFPAVLNGKVVGSLVAPAGAEANLVAIKEDKVGLEFNGGGTWLPADQTDVLARVKPRP